MLIRVSYSVNNYHVVAIVLQEASLEMWPYLSLKCVIFQYMQWRKSEFKYHTAIMRTYRVVWLFCILCTVLT